MTARSRSVLPLVLTVLVALSPQRLLGAVGEGTNPGPDRGGIRALAIDSSTPARTYAGTGGAVYEYLTVEPPSDRRIFPVVGSTPGTNGTFFRTSVQLHNPGSAPMAGRVLFHPSGAAGSDSDPALRYRLAPGETQSIADLLPAMGLSGLGSADIEITSGGVPVATARVNMATATTPTVMKNRPNPWRRLETSDAR